MDERAIWSLSRAECLAGAPFWGRCEQCADRTDLAAFCRFCDGPIEWTYGTSGGIRDWDRFQDESLATLDWSWLGPEATALVRAYAEGLLDHMRAGTGLVLVGSPGCGKTHIAVGLGLLALAHGFTTHATTFGDLLLAVRSSFEKDSGVQESDLMRTVCGVDLLILDDLAMEKPSPWAIDRLSYLVNQRYSHGRATIVTTNAHPAELERVWSERVSSRLCQSGRMISLAGVGDYRSQNKDDALSSGQHADGWHDPGQSEIRGGRGNGVLSARKP